MAAGSDYLERLKAALAYDPATGHFTHIRTGRRAGTLMATGYRRLNVAGLTAKEHRIAWLFMTGAMPSGLIDHINGDKADNRFENLRIVSISANNQNRVVASRSNKSGFLGVFWKTNGYRAEIGVNGRMIYVGTFRTPEEASAAYWNAKRKYHPFAERRL